MATKKKMDARTKKLLIDSDVMTSAGLTQYPKPRRCRRCSAACLAGIADIGPYAGVWLSWTPINAFGEYLAMSAGIKTYEATPDGLHLRTSVCITAMSADEIKIHPLHVCKDPPPLPANEKFFRPFPIKANIQFADSPPF